MSPLARSLLALAALLNAADAIAPNPYCNHLILGSQTSDYYDFTLTAGEGILSIPDKCSRPGRDIAGQDVGACNIPNYKPGIIPPLQDYAYQWIPNYSGVYIMCPSDVTGCNRLDVQVRQYCKMVVSPY